jgi:hypothetical protein
MRRMAYRILLIAVWIAGLVAMALALDGIEHPPFIPLALIGGAWFAAFATVSLAEEIGEWMATLQKSRNSLPARLIDCDPTLLAELDRQPRN